MPDPSPGPADMVRTIAGFARELRDEGLAVGSGDVVTCCAAMATLEPTDLVDLYWGGRATLVTRYDQIAAYDAVFRRYFLGTGDPPDGPTPFDLKAREEVESMLEAPEGEPARRGGDEKEARLGLLASDVAILKGKSFAACTPEELAALRRIMRTLRLTPPRRRARRSTRSPAGRTPDLRRTVRETMRMHGEPSELFWRRRRLRLRPLILILDVSGSMTDYSRNLLQFAHSTRRATARVEVFCFGTRLTRITRQLEHRRPDEALARAADAVFDWDGGTRIGDSLTTFVNDWGRRGVCRGGIVVICSDGLDRGDPSVLEHAMERISRLCHRVVWLNPHKGDQADFAPSTLGMMAAAPHVDLLLSGRDLDSLEDFAELLPGLG